MTQRASLLAGAAAAIALRALLPKVILLRLRRDVERLNAGDYGPFLSTFADDAVLHFNEGAHRWSGDHRGKAAIELFLRDFTAAGLRGEIGDVWISGPPWALKLVARFDDEAIGPEGEQLYSNEVIVVVRTRWGKIVEQEDFYHDTARMMSFEERLQELGILAVAAA